MELIENNTRERGCWNFNVAAGYKNALDRCLDKLQESVDWLEKYHNEVKAQESMREAQAYMDEAGRWFTKANNQQFRIEALVREIKVLRSGQGVSYPVGQDPTNDEWRQASESPTNG